MKKRTLFALIVWMVIATLACQLAPTPATVPTQVPTDTPEPTEKPTDTPMPTNTPMPTDTPLPTSTPKPTNTPKPTDTPPPTDIPKPTSPPAPTVPTAPPVSGVASTFLADARQTKEDLLTIKTWFDKLAGGESVYCSTVYGHTIHRPASTAPSTVPDLVPTWSEYQAAIADGQTCFQWMIDFCDQGGGVIDTATFWNRRDLSSSALSHAEHVVQELEAITK
jgi:hypothetical protein